MDPKNTLVYDPDFRSKLYILGEKNEWVEQGYGSAIVINKVKVVNSFIIQEKNNKESLKFISESSNKEILDLNIT